MSNYLELDLQNGASGTRFKQGSERAFTSLDVPM